MLIDREVGSLINPAMVEDVGDRNLTLIILDKIVESDSGLETDESVGEVEKESEIALLLENARWSSGIVEALPRTSGWVNLVRFELT